MSFDAMLGSSELALKAYHEFCENPETPSKFQSLSHTEKSALAIKHPALMLEIIKAEGELLHLLMIRQTQDPSTPQLRSDSAIYQSAHQNIKVANVLYQGRSYYLKKLPSFEWIRIVLSHHQLIDRMFTENKLKKLSKEDLSFFVTCLSLSGIEEYAHLEEIRRDSLCLSTLSYGLKLILKLNTAAYILLFSRITKIKIPENDYFPSSIRKRLPAILHYSFIHQVPNHIQQHQNQWLLKLGCTLNKEDQNNFQEPLDYLLKRSKSDIYYILDSYEPRALALAIILDSSLENRNHPKFPTISQRMELIQKWGLKKCIQNYQEMKDSLIRIKQQRKLSTLKESQEVEESNTGLVVTTQNDGEDVVDSDNNGISPILSSDLKSALEAQQQVLESQNISGTPSTSKQEPAVSTTLLLHYERNGFSTASSNHDTSDQPNPTHYIKAVIKYCTIQ